MSEIGGWLYAVFVISLSAGAVEIFAPIGQTKKYVRYLVSLVILIALAAPLSRLASYIPKMVEALSAMSYSTELFEPVSSDGKLYDELVNAGRIGIEKSIEESTCERFLIDAEDLSVSVSLDDGDLESIVVETVDVCLSKDIITVSVRDVVEYVKQISGCERVTAVDEIEAG